MPTDPPLLTCTLKQLPSHMIVPAAQIAMAIRPENDPYVGQETGPLRKVLIEPAPPERAAVLTSKYWGKKGAADLSVGFMDNPSAELRAKILMYANMWGKTANVHFRESNVSPQIRITRTPGEGYYNYLGVDCLSIPADQNTMNLDSFTMSVPDSEFLRIVPHEFGHGLGLIHEHMRRQLVALIVPELAYPYYRRNQGWNHQEVNQQVLKVANDEDFLLATPPEPGSIMCYDIPGEITVDGKPIIGGHDITAYDYKLIGILYPLPAAV